MERYEFLLYAGLIISCTVRNRWLRSFLLLFFGQEDVRQAVLIIFLRDKEARNLVLDAPASCLKWKNPDWYRISACPVSNDHIQKISADTPCKVV